MSVATPMATATRNEVDVGRLAVEPRAGLLSPNQIDATGP
jgi:hypothetical protein